MKKLFLSGLMASALVIPAAAYAAPAQEGSIPPKPPAKTAPIKPRAAGPMRGSMHDMMHNKMRLVKRLSAMETAIGIRSNQLDAWRKYSSSLVDMVGSMHEMRGPKLADNAKAKNEIFGERAADHMISQAKKAEAFKSAAAQLRKTLDVDQLRRLNEMNRPHPRPNRGPGHHHQMPQKQQNANPKK